MRINQSHPRAASIHIDAVALQKNLHRVKTIAPQCKVMAVIKANAYGHGAVVAAESLSDADAFALAYPGEAIALRRAGITKPLVVLQGYANSEELEVMDELSIQPVIHQLWQIDLLEQKTGGHLDVWLKIDTGMHRLGIAYQDVDLAYERLQTCQSVKNISLMSHFANADEPGNPFNSEQLSLFREVADRLGIEASMANSAAVLTRPESHFEWLRPGIMLYGSSPVSGETAKQHELEAVMNFESRLAAVNLLKQGDAIGYGSTWKCPEAMPVGVVAAGYADGYPRNMPSGTPVWINGKECPLVGRVSMDSLVVDLRDVAAKPGDRVVLWGKELPVDTVAAAADTIGYELLCRAGGDFISPRNL